MTSIVPHRTKSQRRVLAGRRNQKLRKPLTEEARERLRMAIAIHQPWLRSTGPRTAAGKRASAINGSLTGNGNKGVRQFQRDRAEVMALVVAMRKIRRIVYDD